MANASSLEDYLSRIPPNDLKQPIDYENMDRGQYIPKDLGRIADLMPSWEGSATEALGLGDAAVAQIREKYPGKPGMLRREVLKLWRAKRGAARSTPEELITAFYNHGLHDHCDAVCRALEPPGTTQMPEKKPKIEINHETSPPSKKSRQETDFDEVDNTATATNEAIARASPSDTKNDPFHWCSFIGQQGLSVQPSAGAVVASDKARPAVFLRGVNLWTKPQITVAFTYESFRYLQKWTLRVEDILELANRWQTEPPNHNIPKFIAHGSQIVQGADIIVELNEDGNTRALPGNAGKAGSTDPTMWLDLSNRNISYNQHLVVHEFGHALGLGHEHQRSDFRACVIPFLDEMKMRNDLKERYEDWETSDELDLEKAPEYDPESVMHYWCKKEWLKYGYDDKRKINADSEKEILSKKMSNALLAVHKCKWETLPTKPSTKDLAFVSRMYGHGQLIKPDHED